ncbi:TPA: aspartate carbamoyltransferase [Candidatus Micrarchaeota archaeon]|nr:aspartate carbamoyltransferase [Candidatus Micrarchaeota archaeon]HIH30658.1 aspartate carbamoyltransferase [Candidatus Micrarchaeota archaeon]
MHDLVSIRDLGKKDVEAVLSEAARMEKMPPKKSGELLRGKLVSTMFFEPSTRTNMSFQAAAKRLGAKLMTFYPSVSSTAKGETLGDTIRMIDGYVDAIVLRHPYEGAARYAADLAEHPVINAGDGGNQHPTQTLLDLYTIKKLKGKISGLRVSLMGDLKHARTMRSLLYGLGMFGADVNLVSPSALRMDEEVIRETKGMFGINVSQTSDINLKGVDVLYVCRIQKERFQDKYEGEKMQKEFRVDLEALRGAPEDLAILHPLPKVEEIPPEVDSDPRAKYFEQAKNGVPVRMAVLYLASKG